MSVNGSPDERSEIRDDGLRHRRERKKMILTRLLASILTLAFVCPASFAHAQGGAKQFRIGFVVLSAPATTQEWMRAFRDQLRTLGYEEGKNLVIESRYANGDRARLKELVTELAGRKVDLFFAPGEPALLAAKAHGENIPIVTVTCDPLHKLLGSLARPGGNATGFTCISADLAGKRFGLLRTILPNATRLALLYGEADNLESEVQELESAGRQAGMEVSRHPVRSPQDFAPAFKRMGEEKSEALYILASSFANLHRSKLAELALAHKVPAMYAFREFAEAGGLVTYGAPVSDGFKRAAYQIDKIFKGAAPADVPVEQPTIFELALNMRTAQALGLSIPESLLVLANHVIE
jgi:putative ABC transport system substrate-binding protein